MPFHYHRQVVGYIYGLRTILVYVSKLATETASHLVTGFIPRKQFLAWLIRRCSLFLTKSIILSLRFPWDSTGHLIRFTSNLIPFLFITPYSSFACSSLWEVPGLIVSITLGFCRSMPLKFYDIAIQILQICFFC